MKELRQENQSITVEWLCSAMNLAKSSFYAGLKSIAIREEKDRVIWQKAQALWRYFPGIGYRKIAARLGLGKEKVRRVLRRYRTPSSVRFSTPPAIRKVPNVIKLITRSLIQNPEKRLRANWVFRDGVNQYRKVIDPTRPYQLWSGDWKEIYLPLLGVKVYLFAIIDCYSKQLMSWKLSVIKDANAAIQTAAMAIEKASQDPLFKPRRLIMHTDQGSAYLADQTIQYWRGFGVILSTSDPGKPTQNPYIESFFSIVSRFWLQYHELLTMEDTNRSLTEFFQRYNADWPHSALNYESPDQKLKNYRLAAAP